MDEQTRKQSPIFTKTSDFLMWLMDCTEGFPKSERFRLARRLEDSAFGFYELLIEAARAVDKRQLLLQADLELNKLRLYVRLAQTRKLISLKRYQEASHLMVELGRLLGGWLKSLPE